MKQLLMVFMTMLASIYGAAQPENSAAGGSPFFLIQSDEVSLEEFPLLSTKADVIITGPIADVTITQSYKNEGNIPIEAVYVFPLSTRAAVYEMVMKIGDRTIRAEIQEKKVAKANYEKAKAEGKRASLLEQFRPNVFQMNVGNILPGELIQLELKYTEFLIPENGEYSFVYPSVVGPRFNNPDDQNEEDQFVNSPYSKEGSLAKYIFDIEVQLNAGMQIQESISPSHKVDIQYKNGNSAKVKLKSSENYKGNKDFIFNYSLKDEQISEGTFLYSDGKEQFFLTMIQPPSIIDECELPPREYIFVVDISGSMFGFPLDISKRLMRDLISKLKPTDKFNILLFAGGSEILSPISLAATEANLALANTFIDSQEGRGGTYLLPALKKALDLPADQRINSRSIVVVTDGYVHVEREAFELIANNLNKSNLFAFGIGSSVNRHLIEGMAHAGQGEAFIITDQKYANREAEKFRKYIQQPLLTNINVEYDGFYAYDVSPATLPDLLVNRPLYLFGKYTGNSSGKIRISGFQGNHPYEEVIGINPELIDVNNKSIMYLWAREKIRWLEDLNALSQTEGDVAEVTRLGLTYNLLTNQTSFIAIDETPVLPNDLNTMKVQQVLPLPEGVSGYAVGFDMKIEGVSESKNDEIIRKLFVHIEGDATQSFKTALYNLVQKEILFTTEEKDFLNFNSISIQYDAEESRWLITDSRNNLTTAFIEQFIDEMSKLLRMDDHSFNLTMNMLWV